MRRRALLASSTMQGVGGSEITFPAVIVFYQDYDSPNKSNLSIAEYFLDKYPNMIVSSRGQYTPITEDVEIQGSLDCDGKVIGVAKFVESTMDYISLLFYTNKSISRFYGLKLIVKDTSIPGGFTSEWFYD